MDHYDYIFTGAGCAGLSLLARMIASGKFIDKKILLIDQSHKIKNDRTWCFWEKEAGFFESIVYHKWDKIWFYAKDYQSLKPIHSYQYKMIRGIDFYTYCFDIINKQKNITVLYTDVQKISSAPNETFVIAGGEKITTNYIFNSILFEKPAINKNQFYLLQHFKGWIIETAANVFNAAEATLMDFRISQQYGTAFVYVMPFSKTKALIEYTLFTENLLSKELYEEGLRNYIHQHLTTGGYKITDEEFGIIPMTNYNFTRSENNIINIGTAGGQTKASSGYTFQFIQKQSALITDALLQTGKPLVPKTKKRFHFYDSVLLNVLATAKLPGDKVFTDLFSKNNVIDIFNFLDNESNLLQEIRIINTLPTMPFLHAGLKEFF